MSVAGFGGGAGFSLSLSKHQNIYEITRFTGQMVFIIRKKHQQTPIYSIKKKIKLKMCKILFSPWEEVRGSVEDFMAGLGGLVSATQALHTKKSTKLKKI